ncbi:MAG: MFS transporter [Nevskiaceae bacterium]|nr:MAG: MFS transporter [Nevskiaceae bacterium]TBR74271.1 MAG: MFS transporter [Nevskiaceae bacterium]
MATTTALHASPGRMPRGIPFIIVNEFAERFCYYGINSILSVYLTQTLLFGDAQATTWQSLFKSAAYLFPLLGAVLSDVWWGKYRTIMAFSMVYTVGCFLLAFNTGTVQLAAGLFLVAFGTGGIKPCVSTNVGDQFTEANRHLIERAFSWFYIGINAGALISIWLCPILLPAWGPEWAFGVPGAMMAVSVLIFWLGRHHYAVVPPAGRAWLKELASPQARRAIGALAVLYLFIAVYWSLWDQSNGTTWVLQATSDLMDKDLGFGLHILPAQIQIANGLFILLLVPVFSYLVYPLVGRVVRVTPLRKIGAGLFTITGAFLIVAWIAARIQHGESVSVWWQILAYFVLTASEVLVSITALEFSYTQAPLKLKSFIMALFLLSTSLGNLITAGVNAWMVRPLPVAAVAAGAQTWVEIADAARLVAGQKIDFSGATGLTVERADGRREALSGTYLVAVVDAAHSRVELADAIHRRPVATQGEFRPATARVSTYALIGGDYFLFFAALMAGVGVLFTLVAPFYRERHYVRTDAG